MHHVGLVNWRPPPRHLRELSVVEVLQRGRVDGQTRVGGHARIVHPEARRVQGVDFGEGRLLRSPKLSDKKKHSRLRELGPRSLKDTVGRIHATYGPSCYPSLVNFPHLMSSGLMKLTPRCLNRATVPDIKSSSLLAEGFIGLGGTAARCPRRSCCLRSSSVRGRQLLALLS